jgi:TatD DNase family protein
VIDFHCHLDLYPDPVAVARECIERRLYVLSVTTTPSAWAGTVALAEGATRIRTGLGLHPQLAHERKGEIGLFRELLPQTKYVGEIGLDGAPEFRMHWREQVDVFREILTACEESGGRVLSIHSRLATSPVLDILAGQPAAGLPILHWFTGSHRELARAIGLGCWFSVGPAMLRTQKGRALMEAMPRDRILTETDGPFARVQGRSALPWEADLALDALAEAWNEPVATARERLRSNLASLAVALPGTSEIDKGQPDGR